MVDDQGDLEIMKTRRPELDVMPGGKTVKVESPLQDADGETIGAFMRLSGTTGSQTDLEERARRIGVELQRQIPDLASLTARR